MNDDRSTTDNIPVRLTRPPRRRGTLSPPLDRVDEQDEPDSRPATRQAPSVLTEGVISYHQATSERHRSFQLQRAPALRWKEKRRTHFSLNPTSPRSESLSWQLTRSPAEHSTGESAPTSPASVASSPTGLDLTDYARSLIGHEGLLSTTSNWDTSLTDSSMRTASTPLESRTDSSSIPQKSTSSRGAFPDNRSASLTRNTIVPVTNHYLAEGSVPVLPNHSKYTVKPFNSDNPVDVFNFPITAAEAHIMQGARSSWQLSVTNTYRSDSRSFQETDGGQWYRTVVLSRRHEGDDKEVRLVARSFLTRVPGTRVSSECEAESQASSYSTLQDYDDDVDLVQDEEEGWTDFEDI